MASVAEIIHEHQTDIMKRWAREARAAASARGLSAASLDNVMGSFLSALADQRETGQADASERRRQRLLAHLSSRIRQGFDLAEIVEEFALLGRCIATVWQSLPEEQWPPAADIERLQLEIQGAMTAVTNAFQRHMLEDEQSEKRYLRRLQVVASEALHDVKAPLRERLRDALEVVMEAMDAQCAAILLYSVAEAKLLLAACVGDEALEQYATSLDPRSFAGEVASHEQPTPMYNVTSTSLEVPETLRHSGIHSLLGIRLPPSNSILGVMYIGISEAREFTPRELGRIESLGERFALHLESARLFAELQETIASLDIEKALRERFVATLAHDLRGPLSAARLAASLLPMEPTSLEERRDLAARIDSNIRRVDHMISDLLDANRIRAGEPLPLRLAACDLVVLVQQVADEARAMHGDRFVVEFEGPVHGICSEEDLHRALWNLVTNAVKYGARKEPITIVVSQRDGLVRISVHNGGTPIPTAEQAHIFDAYARVPSVDANGPIGWGLGLTIVRGVAEAHGGSVSLTSDAASGTTFTIELPLDARSARGSSDERASPTVH